MNLHIAPSAAESNARSRHFRARIASIHYHKTWSGVSQESHWPDMWMWDLVTMPARLPRATLHAVPLDRIISAVCENYEVTRNELLSPCRQNTVTEARHVICYLARKCTRHSYHWIAGRLDRDHTVVVYAHKKIAGRIKEEPAFANNIDSLIRRLAP